MTFIADLWLPILLATALVFIVSTIMLPRPKDMKDCNKPEFVEKLTRGPVAILTVVPNDAYAVGLSQNSIWFHRPWSNTLKHTLDGLIYGCLTGGAFGWLWN